MAVVRRANELFVAGRLEEAFESWSAAFGADWTSHLTVRRELETEDGRVLTEYEFKASGTESDIPVDQQLAGIYTVEDAAWSRVSTS